MIAPDDAPRAPDADVMTAAELDRVYRKAYGGMVRADGVGRGLLAVAREAARRATAAADDRVRVAESRYEIANMLLRVQLRGTDGEKANAIGRLVGERDAAQAEARSQTARLLAALAEVERMRGALEDLAAALRAERAPLLALVAALPRCDGCDKPATKAWQRGSFRFCDDHAPDGCPDYPRAPALRSALALTTPTKPARSTP